MTTRARVHQRHEHQIAVVILTDQGEVEGKTTNLSLGGMFVEAGEPIPFGAQVKVRFWLPALKEETVVDATVRWQRGSGLGLQFGSLRAREVWALNQLFKERDTG